MGTQILRFLFFIATPGKSVREKNTRGPFKHPPYYTHFPLKSGSTLHLGYRVSMSPHSLQTSAPFQPLLPSGPWPPPLSLPGAAQAPGHASPPRDVVLVPPELCRPITSHWHTWPVSTYKVLVYNDMCEKKCKRPCQ